MASETGGSPRVLQGARFWKYTVGVLGQFIPATLITAFASHYYIYVVGLDALIVNIVTAIGSLFNGISSPIFGTIIDNHSPSARGKRKPFLLYGIPFMSVFLVLMWTVPVLCDVQNCTDLRISLWFLVSVLLFYFGFALVRNAYLSSLPEQSEDDKNRVSISALQGVFSILATIISILLPLVLYAFLDDPSQPFHTTPDGRFMLGTLPWIAISFAALGIVVTLLAYSAMDETHLIDDAARAKPKTKVVDVIKGILHPFTDKENARWLAASFCMNTAMRMIVKQLAPIFTFVFEVRGAGFPVMMVLLIPFAGIGFWYWQKRAKRGLKKAYTTSSYAISATFAVAFTLFFIPDFAVRLVAAFVVIAAILFNLVTGFLLPNPIISKIVDVAGTSSHGVDKKVSGAYFGSFLFTLNIANALGDVILGFVLAGPNAYLGFFINLVFPVSALLYLASAAIFARSRIE